MKIDQILTATATRGVRRPDRESSSHASWLDDQGDAYVVVRAYAPGSDAWGEISCYWQVEGGGHDGRYAPARYRSLDAMVDDIVHLVALGPVNPGIEFLGLMGLRS